MSGLAGDFAAECAARWGAAVAEGGAREGGVAVSFDADRLCVRVAFARAAYGSAEIAAEAAIACASAMEGRVFDGMALGACV